MEKFKRPGRLIVIGSLFFLAVIGSVRANKVITNETVEEELNKTVAFRKSHNVMSENQNRLHSILNAFLIGDLSSIKIFASEIAASLGSITTFLPAAGDPESQAQGWQAIAQVSQQAKEIENSVNEEDFVGAYNHYAALTFQCVKCHQAVRSWGEFSAPKPKELEEPKKNGSRIKR